MKAKRSLLDKVVGEVRHMLRHSRKRSTRKPQSNPEEFSLGQRLADWMANYVGSWSFIFAQSTVLIVWIVLNILPGFSHWDPAPFILLNLVFSFASAYTAPVVLISQNRQSEIDRRNAAYDYQVNVKAGQDIERLHDKMDTLWEQELRELTQLVKQQQQCIEELRLSLGQSHPVKVPASGKLLDGFSEGKSFNLGKSMNNNTKFADKGMGQIS